MAKEKAVKLTAKQEAFCLEYLKDLNATQAAVRAGYSAKTANQIGPENLVKLGISEKIAELMEKRNEKINIDAEWVLRKAVELHDRCSQAVAVTDREGKPVKDDEGNPIYAFEHTGVSKALDIIGKHVDVNAFKQVIEHSGEVVMFNMDFGSKKDD